MSKTLREEMRFDEFVTCYREQWDSIQNYRYLKPRKCANYVIFARFEFTTHYERYTVFVYRAKTVRIGNPANNKVRTEKRYEEILKFRYDPIYIEEQGCYDEEALFTFAEEMLETYNML